MALHCVAVLDNASALPSNCALLSTNWGSLFERFEGFSTQEATFGAFPDIAEVISVGGVSLMGGKGSIIGTILGAVILGALRNGLTLINVQAFNQLVATGIIIIVAMLIDGATRGK